VIIIELIILFAAMALIFRASRRKIKKTAIHQDPALKLAEPVTNDREQVVLTISSRVTTDSYFHDPKDDTYLETPHPDINRKALSLPLPLKEGEQITRDESAAKILKVPRNNNGEEHRLEGNRRRFVYRCENLGTGRLILTNKSLFILPDCTGKAIRIGLRAIGSPSWNDRKSAVLQIYKHDYDYPSDYRIYGLDAQSWWRSIKPKG
jgi:hypothetical protein